MKRILAIALCLALFALPALGEQAPAMPDALAGVWQGEGSDGISLTITLNEDGTGVYEFEQDGYTESLPFTAAFTGDQFRMALAENDVLLGAEGKWTLMGDVLTLEITSTLPGGDTYSYTAVCTRKASASEAQPVKEVTVDEILDALGEGPYRAVYDALSAGTVIGSGSRGDTALGVQQTLVALGQNIVADGAVGPRTLAALNAVQAEYGQPQTDSVDAECYARLLPCLLTCTDPETADALLGPAMGGEYQYMKGCALFSRGLYYSAREAFAQSDHDGAAARAEACAQPWPATGLIERGAVRGYEAQIRVRLNGAEDTAMAARIYTEDGALAATLFIAGSGEATASLPAGRYVVRDGIGAVWYGPVETFGREGAYETMTFDGGETLLTLEKGERVTITVNVEAYSPDAEKVFAEPVGWEGF